MLIFSKTGLPRSMEIGVWKEEGGGCFNLPTTTANGLIKINYDKFPH